jgi:hypothetical protein
VRRAGDDESVTGALFRLGSILIDIGEYERALPVTDECVSQCRALCNVPMRCNLTRALLVRAIAARFSGNYRQSLADLDESERANREAVSRVVSRDMNIAFQRGFTLLEMGDRAAAVSSFKMSLGVFRDVPAARGDTSQPPLAMAALADVLWACGQPQPAMWLAGAAAARADDVRGNNAYELIAYERTLAKARAQLDDPALAAAWAEGQAMSWDQAIEYALALPEPASG